MNVTILTEGGGDIGYGHISRCTSIYQAFEEKGITPEFIVHGEKHIESLLKGKRYRFLDWINNRELLFEVLKDCNIVFIDSYLAGHDIYKRISEQAETAVFFDDDIRMEYPEGFVLNGAILAEDMPYPNKEGITYLLGAQYAPLRKEFWDIPAKLIRKNIETLMVTFGGSDMYNVTPKIQRLLNDSYPDFQKKIIVTKLFSNISEIKKLQDKKTELLCDLNAIDFKAVMQDSDIAISAGGQTLYELARTALATIGICIAENQLQNIHGWEESGFLEYIGWYNDENLLNNLRDAISKLMPYKERLRRSESGRNYIDGKGVKRIIGKLTNRVGIG